jgi:hypothetical protein
MSKTGYLTHLCMLASMLLGCSSDSGATLDAEAGAHAADGAVDGPPAADGPPEYAPEFEERFDAILATLLEHWHDSGDWEGDMQGDATAFAPALLYRLGKEDPDLWDKAAVTARYEVGLIQELAQTRELNMDAVVGFPALGDCYRFEEAAGCGLWLAAGTVAGHQVISERPEDLLPYVFDMATVFGTGATMCLDAAEVLQDESLQDKGLELIARADADYWDEEQGLYSWSQVIDWPQATMMMALTRAYRITGEQKYLDRCERILASMNACCWDDAAAGYFGHWGQHIKGLSGNNGMILALLDLYESTGDTTYLDRAQVIIRWVLSEDLYSADTGLLQHHWESPSGDQPGRADYYCTGCNFATLVNVHRYHRLQRERQ